MEKIKIITDSTCDLGQEELRKLNVDYVPVSVIIDGKKYRQYIDITNKELYHKLIDEQKKISTAASTPGEIMEVFERNLDDYDSIIFISVSSKVSCLFQNALLVAKNYLKGKDITIIDSKSVSLPQGLLVQEAAEMLKLGKSKKEIVERLRYLSNYTRALPLLRNLEYMHRGGRIKLYQRILGSLFKINVLVRIDNEGANIDGKVKGYKNALINLKMCGLQIQQYLKINRMFVAYTTNKELAEEIANFLRENGDKKVQVDVAQLGPVIGAHGGDNVVGYGFIGDYHPDMFNKVGEPAQSPTQQKLLSKTKG
jgi:DegV family protein with EDD domain